MDDEDKANLRKVIWGVAYLLALHANITNDPIKSSETAADESEEDANEAVSRFDKFVNKPVEE